MAPHPTARRPRKDKGHLKVIKAPRSCGQCGKPLRTDRLQGKFCSPACYYEFTKRSNDERFSFTCAMCGKPFRTSQGQGSRKFCSKACLDQSLRKSSIPRQCEHCGKSFEVKPSQAERGHGRFCSQRCRAYAQNVGKTIGIKRDGTPPSSYYANQEWLKLAAAVRKRDGYVCQHCNRAHKPGTRDLHAHHVVPVRRGGKDELSNLIALCSRCHKRADAAMRKEEGIPNPRAGMPGTQHTQASRAKISHGNRGKVRTPEMRARNSAARKGKPLTEKQLAAVRAAAANRRGRKNTEKQRLALIESNRNRVWTEEARANIGNANRGRVVSDQTRAKQSETHKRRYDDPSARANLSEIMKKRFADPALRAKMSAIRTGTVRSAETCAKLSASVRESWRRRKEARSGPTREIQGTLFD